MSHEIRLIRCLSKKATETLLVHPPTQEPRNRLKVLDPPRNTNIRSMRASELVRRQFLAMSLRQLFSGEEGSERIAVLSYATTSIIAARQADKRGRRIRYGVDASGPFKRIVYRRIGPFQRKTLERHISFEELLCHAKDPEETYRSICALIIEGAVAILGLDETKSIVESEQRPQGATAHFRQTE